MQMPPILMNKAEREYQLRQQDKDHNKAIMYVRSYGGIRAFDSNGFLQSRDAIILASEQEKRRRSEIACLQRCEDEDNERKKDRLKERQRIESIERIEDDYSNRLNMNALPNENLLEEALSSYSRALRSFAFF
ncbi:MAG: hypothetical protein EZS28_000914 [Streblomastix strix]|uniref:Uncharacterized protein n=1 Tax=Streblomastix strix TaxID=222440 RepID=A0A5J4X8Q0_9EUKA|nr:MAG: hypothetical protein EZS28_000914 [Streblomastix strix]